MNPALKQRISHTFSNYRWILHILFWTFFCLTSFNLKIRNGYFDPQKFPGYFSVIILWIFLIIQLLQTYVLILVIIPLYKKGKEYIFWPVLLVTIIGFHTACVMLTKLFIIQFPIFNQKSQFDLIVMLQGNLGIYVLFSCVALAFYYFIDIHDQQKKIQRLEHYKTRKIALESSFLKSQINPHFLFNTLNNIYALSLKKSEQTPVIIDRLESLLHYMLYECKSDFVPLENEFIFTNSYIELEKLRHKAEQCTITIQIEGDPSGHQVAPLLLINFLENAFKHGTKTSFGKSWIEMNILISKEDFHFKLKNSKPKNIVSQPIAEYRGGIGLKNVKRRLEILYPKKHELIINDLQDYFEVDLTVSF